MEKLQQDPANRLETRNLTVRYGGRTILDHISADFQCGTMTAVIGSNGVGKTTYLKAIAGLIRTEGKVEFCENGERRYRRKEIAYVPQLGALQTRLTVFEMVLLGMVGSLKWHVRKEQLDQVYQVLEDLGITAIADQPFHTLSGGQKQLVSMAQSFIGRPRVLLLDEPTSALDLRHQLIVMDLAQRYTREQNAVTVFVVHDLMLASRYGEYMVVLHDGKVFAQDKAANILNRELIETVYAVSSRVMGLPEGYQIVLPIRPLSEQERLQSGKGKE